MMLKRLLSFVAGSALALTAGVTAAQTPPPPPPVYGAPITLDQAKKVMAGAEAEAKKNNWGMAIIILDSGGNMVMMQRMGGTQLGSMDVARDKAYSAVACRSRPTARSSVRSACPAAPGHRTGRWRRRGSTT